jgi:hypothetical protein
MTDNGNGERDRLARAVELAIYAPIGVGLYLRDLAPTVVNMFVARGRAEVDRHQQAVQQHVTSAKSFGEVTLAFGIPMLRQRVQTHVNTLRGKQPENDAPVAAAPTPEPAVAPVPEPVTATPDPPRWEPATPPPLLSSIPTYDPEARADLPIPGYDALSASQVVERLAGLPPSELDAVYAYEAAHRQRRTILGKIEQLAV